MFAFNKVALIFLLIKIFQKKVVYRCCPLSTGKKAKLRTKVTEDFNVFEYNLPTT